MANTFTVRKDRSPQGRIVKFRADALDAMIGQDAEAFALAWNKMKSDMQSLGIKARLDHENECKVLQALKAEDDGTWRSRLSACDFHSQLVIRNFAAGIMGSGTMEF